MDCMIVSLGCGFDGVVFRFRIVRGFCFVKYDAREIPAFAGMTWEVAGVTKGLWE